MGFERKKHFGVTHRNAVLREPALHLRREVQQAHAIGHGCATLANLLCDVFLPQSKFASQPRKGPGFLDRVQILALQILDEREFEDILVGRFAHNDRRFGESDALRRAPAAFARDDFEAVAAPPDDQRLNDAVLFDALDELVDRLVGKVCARLERRRHDLSERHMLHALAIFNGGCRRHDMRLDEGAEAFSEDSFCHRILEAIGQRDERQDCWREISIDRRSDGGLSTPRPARSIPIMSASLLRRRETAPVPHRFTVEDFHLMGEVGLLNDNRRYELLEGEIIEMFPPGNIHSSHVDRAHAEIFDRLRRKDHLRNQGNVQVSDISEPLPDLVILRPSGDEYSTAAPTAKDILLLIEVADSSLAYDRDRKARIYGHAGVPEYWIVDTRGRQVLVFRKPRRTGYGEMKVHAPGDTLRALKVPELLLAVSDLLVRPK